MTLRARLEAMREELARLVAEARAFLDTAQDEERALTSEEREGIEQRHTRVTEIQEEMRTIERQLDAEAELARRQPTSRTTGNPELSEDPEEAAEQQRQAYTTWLRGGLHALTSEERSLLAGLSFRADRDDLEHLQSELRAQSVGTDAGGGFTVPEGPMAPLERAMLAFGGMLEAANVITTDHGRDIPMPETDDTGNEGALISENAEVAEQDATFGSKTLKAYKFTSKLIRVPIELIEDSNFDIATLVSEMLGERLGRAVNRYTTVGTGTNEPQGAVTASALGKTAAAAAAIVYGEIFDLFHSVDPAYRNGPKVRWMFNDTTLGKIKQIKDDANHLIFQRDLAGGTPATLDGKPYTINQNMASPATGEKTILFGDFSKFWIRRVRGVRVVRLAERFAEFDQVGFLAFNRLDSRLRDAGTKPLKHLIQA